jgi:D-tyrosyl-tRNA(Tyr) deacylase
MRLIVQRVSQAKVLVAEEICGSIQKGLLVLLGIHREDKIEDVPWFIHKLVHLRIFSDEKGKMNRALHDVAGEVLVVSQFTLYGNCLDGRRPDFIQAAAPDIALPIYQYFVQALSQHVSVQTGQFGAEMQVFSVNEGPVTFIIERGKK